MPCTTGWTALETLGISGLAERVYLTLLTRRVATAAEVAGALGLREDHATRSLAEIEHKGLASHTPQSPRVYVVIEPNCAIDALMKQRTMALELVRAAIPAIAGKSTAGPIVHAQQPVLESIGSLEHLKAVLEQMYASFQSEILIFRRAPILFPSIRIPEPLPHHVRAISDRSFMTTPDAPATLRRHIARGEQVRSFTALPFKLMIVDRTTAVILLDRPDTEEATQRFVIHGGALLGALCALFECLWDKATPIVAAPRGKLAARKKNYYTCPGGSAESVVPLLAAGLNDKAIAQELEISASTLNRRIAELMTTFGARTRFQLGLQLGLRRVPERVAGAPTHAA